MKELSTEEKAKRYDKAIAHAEILLKTIGNATLGNLVLKNEFENMFPELAESGDEKIRKELISFVRRFIECHDKPNAERDEKYESWIDWIEKQAEKTEPIEDFDTEFERQISHLIASAINREYEYNKGYIKWTAHSLIEYAKREIEEQGIERKQLYVRFGDIPLNEKSKIYRGEEEIGYENGVSVYPAFELNGNIVLGLTLPITMTTLYTQQHLLEYDNRPCYLVSGDYIGKGTDGEPLIRNISIIKRLYDYRTKSSENQDNKDILENAVLDGNEDGLIAETIKYKNEKQDEQKPIKEHDVCDFCEDRYGCVNPCPTKLIDEQKPVDFSDLRTWKYIVDAVWTEKEGIGQYLDSPFTEEVAKKLQKRFGKIEQKPAEWHREDEQNLNACLGYIPDEFLRKWLTDIIHIKYDKSADKVEPKFKVGDWIVDKNGVVKQILSYNNGIYKHTCGYSSYVFEDEWRLWDITKDAKDGDVLAVEPIEGYSSSFVAIYKKQNEKDFDSYCFVGFDGKFYKNEHGHSTENIHPATKEQRGPLIPKDERSWL